MRRFERQVLADGSVMLHSSACKYVFTRISPDALCITASGNDAGESGTWVVDEVRRAFQPDRPLALFVDIRDAHGAAPSVSDTWIRFLAAHHHELASIDVLVVSPVLKLTVAVITHFAKTARLTRIHADAAVFDALVASASGAAAQAGAGNKKAPHSRSLRGQSFL